MKKKFLTVVLTLICAITFAFGFTACENSSDSADKWGNVYTVEAAYAAAKDLGYNGTLEEFIENISGKDGKDGIGITEALINKDGELIIVLSNGTTKNLGNVIGKDGVDGKDGEDGLSAFEIYKKYHPDFEGTEEDWIESLKGSDGKDGKDGTNGKDGVGIKTAYINDDGELILVLTDGTTIHCGKVIADNTQQPDNGDNNSGNNIDFGLPLENISIIVGYEFTYDPTLDRYAVHQGIDFRAQAGDSVFAIADGVVTKIVTNNILGENYVTLTHINGLSSTYKYIVAKEGLKEGDAVKRGDRIGTIDEARGLEMNYDEHLHLEMRVNGKTVDPAPYLGLNAN